MKKQILSLAVVATTLFASCGGNQETQDTHDEHTEHEAAHHEVTYDADLAASTVNWSGNVIGMHSHEGFVNLKSGTITLTDNVVTAGDFFIDMKTISPTDSASYKPGTDYAIENFVGHLASNDFFAVDSFPTAEFIVTSSEGNNVTGNLTIRNQTHEEVFVVESIEADDTNLKLTGSVTIDRQKYDVAYKSAMKDMVISDDIALTFTVVATH